MSASSSRLKICIERFQRLENDLSLTFPANEVFQWDRTLKFTELRCFQNSVSEHLSWCLLQKGGSSNLQSLLRRRFVISCSVQPDKIQLNRTLEFTELRCFQNSISEHLSWCLLLQAGSKFVLRDINALKATCRWLFQLLKCYLQCPVFSRLYATKAAADFSELPFTPSQPVLSDLFRWGKRGLK
jgi:hypothetical protein